MRAFTFANVNGFQGGPRTVRAYKRVANKGSVLMLAEAWRYRDELKKALPGSWAMVQKPGESAAIAYNTGAWQCLGHGFFKVHETIPGVSDSREAAYAVLRDRDTRETVLVVAVHLTPSAWSNRFGARKRMRIRSVWKKGLLATLRNTRRLQEKHGVPAVIGADVNHKGRTWSKRLGGRTIRYVSDGIDKLAFIDYDDRVWALRASERTLTPLGTGDGHRGITVRAMTRRP